ncbi:MAG UNVERIFIED_CONTAM: MBL fold metallo-hydrolase [Planctomycetaceae bacterium]|jgi:glyoxylase-like metal-dependent hydrolase (beta-lactamase superfamily II)
MPMQERRELFPNVLELNFQARRRMGCCVYLVYGQSDWMLLDIGYEDTVEELIDLIRELNFPLANCTLPRCHTRRCRPRPGLCSGQRAPAFSPTGCPPPRAKILESNDRIAAFAEIPAQQISIDLPALKIDQEIDEGDQLTLDGVSLDVWHTPGHAVGQLSFRFGRLLFSGDNIFRDGCVGSIDAHHGSDLPAFIKSLQRIQNSGVDWLLPSHGPAFRNDRRLLQSAIDRLDRYQHMADFGTCAVDWPLLDDWEDELARGVHPAS